MRNKQIMTTDKLSKAKSCDSEFRIYILTQKFWALVRRSKRLTMHKKGLKFAPVSELAELYFIYIAVCTKIAKARPGFDDRPEYSSVQINSSSP